MELTVKNSKGNDTKKKVKLSDKIFGVKPNDHAIYLDVKRYMAANRAGTHKTKERSEIKGSTRKLRKQKGTGMARVGSIKSPIFRGGGRAFGPRPKDYGFKLNKKVKKLARRSALSYKAKGGQITVIEDLKFDKPKTKDFAEMLKGLKMADKKTLLVVAEPNKNIYLSSRNLQGAKVITASELSTYDIVGAANLLISEGSIENIEKNLG